MIKNKLILKVKNQMSIVIVTSLLLIISNCSNSKREMERRYLVEVNGNSTYTFYGIEILTTSDSVKLFYGCIDSLGKRIMDWKHFRVAKLILFDGKHFLTDIPSDAILPKDYKIPIIISDKEILLDNAEIKKAFLMRDFALGEIFTYRRIQKE